MHLVQHGNDSELVGTMIMLSAHSSGWFRVFITFLEVRIGYDHKLIDKSFVLELLYK